MTTAICAWCLPRLNILDGTSIEQALLDLETEDITHGACKPHFDAMMALARQMPDQRRISA